MGVQVVVLGWCVVSMCLFGVLLAEYGTRVVRVGVLLGLSVGAAG